MESSYNLADADDLDYFQIDVTGSVMVDIEVRIIVQFFLTDYSLQLCDSNDDLIASDTDDFFLNVMDQLEPGMYYIVVGNSKGVVAYTIAVMGTIINPPDPDPNIPTFGSETIDNQEHIAGNPITPVTLPVATGGDGALIYSLTPALPTGLDFNAGTREISGTPTTVTSRTTYTYTVTDDDGDTDDLNFRISVEVPPAPPPPGPTPTPRRPTTSGTDAGGGGGCAVSDQSNVVPDLLGAVACLMLIPVSVVIRRKIMSQINM